MLTPVLNLHSYAAPDGDLLRLRSFGTEPSFLRADTNKSLQNFGNQERRVAASNVWRGEGEIWNLEICIFCFFRMIKIVMRKRD